MGFCFYMLAAGSSCLVAYLTYRFTAIKFAQIKPTLPEKLWVTALCLANSLIVTLLSFGLFCGFLYNEKFGWELVPAGFILWGVFATIGIGLFSEVAIPDMIIHFRQKQSSELSE